MEKITLRGFLLLLLCNLLSQNIFSQCPSIPNTTQYFCDSQDPTIADLTAIDNGNGLQWYATASSTIPLDGASALIDGMTYFADNSAGTCGARESVEVVVYESPDGLSYQGFCITSNTQQTPTIADLYVQGENLTWYDTEFGGNILPESTPLTDGSLYYVSQTPAGTGCETSRFSILVSLFLVTEPPVGDSEQSFCGSTSNPPTVADIIASGQNNWYATPTATNPLNSTTPLVDGATYYGTEVQIPCESESRLAVTVTVFEENRAGDDTVVALCESDLADLGTIDIFDQLEGNPNSGGSWTGDLPVNGTLIDVTGMSAGNSYVFTYTVQNSTDCPADQASVTINVSPALNSGDAGTASFCVNDAGADLFTFLGGTPDAGGTWSPALASGTGFFDPAVDIAGTYTYTVSGSAGCDSSSAAVVVSVAALPQSGNFTGVQDVCATVSGFDLFTLLDGSQDADGIWLNAAGNPVSNVIDPGSLLFGNHPYTYQVTNDCDIATTDVQVNIVSGISSGNPSGNFDYCNPTDTLDLYTLLDGTQDAGGIWSNASGDTVSEIVDLSTLPVGSYTFTYTVNNAVCGNVSTNVTFTVSSNAFTGVFTGSQNVCFTNTSFDLFTLLDGSQAPNGSWVNDNNNIIANPIDVSQLAVGTYEYSYQTDNSCGSSATPVTFVVVEAFSSGDFTGVEEYCGNEGVIDLFDLLMNEDNGGIWTNETGSSVTNTVNVNGLAPGSYNYTYTFDNVDCGSEATTVTFEILPTPSSGVFTGSQNVCPAEGTFNLFNLLDGSEIANGIWTDTSGVVVANPLDVTLLSEGVHTYNYTVNNACGSQQTNVSFLVPSSFDAGTNGNATFCSNDAGADLFDYLGGTPEEGGIWSPELASGTGFFDPAVDAPGTYMYSSALVSDGCFQTSATVEVVVDAAASAGTFTGLVTYCGTENMIDLFDLLTGEDAGGIWTDASGNSVSNQLDISQFDAGTYNYTYTNSNSNCGTVATTVTFEVSEILSSGVFTGSQNVCPSEGTFDLFTLLDGTQDDSGFWLNQSGTVVSNPIDVTQFSAGVYNYTYSVTTTCFTQETNVSFLVPSSFDAGTNGTATFCSNDAGADLFDYLGGTPEEGGIWSPELASGTGFFDPAVDAPGTYIYSSALVSQDCNQTSAIVEVSINPSITSGTFSGTVTYCSTEGIIDLFDMLENESEGGNWTDASGNIVSNQLNSSGFSDGTYTYLYSVSGDCGTESTSVSFQITTSPISAGTFTGMVDVCNLETTFNLNSLLDGTQTTGGIWTDEENNTIDSSISINDFTLGTHSFTYTVTTSCATDSEVVTINIVNTIEMENVAIAVPTEICLGTQALVTLENLVDGLYTIEYNLSGSNEAADQSAVIAVNSGSGSFMINAALLGDAGTTSVTITEIVPQNSNSCNTTSNTLEATFEVVAGPDLQASTLEINNVCLGNDGVLTITGSDLPDGNYQFSYELATTSQSMSYASATITFSNGDGVLTIPASQIVAIDAYMLTITGVINSGTGCANTTLDTFVTFDVIDVPDIDVEQTKLFTQDVCLGSDNDVTISNPSIPDGDYMIAYQVSGVVAYQVADLVVTMNGGEAIFTIPGSALTAEGMVEVLLVSLSDGAVECPIYFNNIAFADFEIYNGDMIEIADDANIFCEQDAATLATLSESLINPEEEVVWYTAAQGGEMYSNEELLVDGVTYYGVYSSYADCPNTERLAVTAEISYCDVMIPDGFSPNGDGVNDTFRIHNLRTYYPNFVLEVYNRYGNQVYQGDSDTPDWDGTTNTGATTIGSNGAPTGVYFYVLKLNVEGRDPIQGRVYLNR